MSKIDSRFQRIPGKQKRVLDKQTGKEYSRRQFDKEFGKLKTQGVKSYEELARYNKGQEGKAQLLKPAKGRASALKLPAEKKREVLAQRVETQTEKRLQNKIQKEESKKLRTPKSLSLKNFKPGKMGRRFNVPFDLITINEFINTAAKFKGSYGYTVGFIFVDTKTGAKGGVTLIRLRDLKMPYELDEFEEMLNYIEERNYIHPLNAVVYIALKQQVAESYANTRKGFKYVK
jgi:hypothetical protein